MARKKGYSEGGVVRQAAKQIAKSDVCGVHQRTWYDVSVANCDSSGGRKLIEAPTMRFPAKLGQAEWLRTRLT